MNEASNYVKGVDNAFYFILGIDAFFLIGITAVMIFFAIKFSRKRNPKATQIKERMWLEVTWTIIPLILVLWMFYYGYAAFKPGRNVPKDAMKVTAVGSMWQWNFIYENGKESNQLVVPVGRPIVLKLESKDVVHSLYIPAFRIKEDMVAGKENFLWFTPTEKDTFDIFLCRILWCTTFVHDFVGYCFGRKRLQSLGFESGKESCNSRYAWI